MRILMSLLVAIFFFGGHAVAGDSDCDELEGAEYGLCVAYCDALDCDSTDGSEPKKACKKLIHIYLERTENLPPCFIALHEGPITEEIIEWVLEYQMYEQSYGEYDIGETVYVSCTVNKDIYIRVEYNYDKQIGSISIKREEMPAGDIDLEASDYYDVKRLFHALYNN